MKATTTAWSVSINESVTSIECRDVTPLGGRITLRAQLGALAAGATIARAKPRLSSACCGSMSCVPQSGFSRWT
ncbi:hypothetical protein Pelo_19661 [Pelomyxa schiedti]|nr:hypothetical protein Pelo_19661 [Pelomyxa schiedti]